MVWARTRLAIWDYVFEPVKQIKLDYTGKNPHLIYKKMHELLRLVFNVPEGYIQEKEYKWEKHKDSEHFEVGWEITKIFDVFTFLSVEIDLRGFVMTESDGKAAIVIRPRIITEYPQDTVLQQSIFYEILRRFWHRIYYHKRRMQYLYYSKDLVVEFERSLKKFFDELRMAK